MKLQAIMSHFRHGWLLFLPVYVCCRAHFAQNTRWVLLSENRWEFVVMNNLSMFRTSSLLHLLCPSRPPLIKKREFPQVTSESTGAPRRSDLSESSYFQDVAWVVRNVPAPPSPPTTNTDSECVSKVHAYTFPLWLAFNAQTGRSVIARTSSHSSRLCGIFTLDKQNQKCGSHLAVRLFLDEVEKIK